MSEPINSVLPEAALSEADFLKRQSEHAHAAIANTLASARASLAEGVDPREWTRKYPIIAIGTAAAAGFVAAVLAIPSKSEPEIHRFEKLHKFLHPKQTKPAETPDNGKSTPQRSIWLTLLHEGVQLLRPVLTSVLFAGLGGQTPNPSPPGYGTSPDETDVNDNKASA